MLQTKEFCPRHVTVSASPRQLASPGDGNEDAVRLRDTTRISTHGSPMLAAPLFPSALYDRGCSSYYNPYYGTGYGLGTTALVQPTSYNHSQPISTTSPAPQPAVVDQAVTSFDSARDAFWSGD
jgi:hypothetical protein